MLSWATTSVRKRQLVLTLGDIMANLAGLFGALAVTPVVMGTSVPNNVATVNLPTLITFVLGQLLAFFIFDLYNLRNRFALARTRALIAVACGATVVATSITLFLFRTMPLGLNVLISYAVFLLALTYSWRLIFFRWLLLPCRARRLLFLGLDPAVRKLISKVVHDEIDRHEVVALLTNDLLNGASPEGVPTGRLCKETIHGLAQDKKVDGIVYSVVANLSEEVLDSLVELGASNIALYDAPSFYAQRYEKVPIGAIDARWLVGAVQRHSHSVLAHTFRRVAEVMVCITVGILSAPLLALLSIAVKLEDGGPILYKQERLGLGRRPFVLYKFRTMIPDAEANTGPVWTRASDPRITRVGWLLRRTGFDELPQLINILRGEMTFVGIRPIREHFAEKLAREIPYYDVRFSIQPGVTGWAQTKYGYGWSKKGQLEKFEYELFYLRNASWLLDTFIIFKTAQKIALMRFSTASHDRTQPGGRATTPDPGKSAC